MVRAEETAAMLRPWLGMLFLSRCDVSEQSSARLNAFDADQGDFDALFHDLDTLLFHFVHDMTQGDMRVLLDDGRAMRVRVDDIDQMADELLYLSLRTITRSPWQCNRLRAYAMTHDSLSAWRALYVDFAGLQTADELALIARTVRGGFPAYRWRGWLRADETIE